MTTEEAKALAIFRQVAELNDLCLRSLSEAAECLEMCKERKALEEDFDLLAKGGAGIKKLITAMRIRTSSQRANGNTNTRGIAA